MKKLTLTILFFFFVTSSANATVTKFVKQENQRQAIAIWQDEKLVIRGMHRPYSTIKLFENENIVAETKSDARGAFTFSLGQRLNPGQKHIIVIKGFDRFGREIKNENGDPDIINKTILPGLQTTGKLTAKDGTPIANATINLYDDEDNLLNQFTSDENGNFTITNAPKDGKIIFNEDGFEEEEIDLNGRDNITITPEIDASNPPKKIKKTEFVYKKPVKETEKKKKEVVTKKNNLIYWGLIGVIFIAGISAFIGLRKKKQ